MTRPCRCAASAPLFHMPSADEMAAWACSVKERRLQREVYGGGVQRTVTKQAGTGSLLHDGAEGQRCGGMRVGRAAVVHSMRSCAQRRHAPREHHQRITDSSTAKEADYWLRRHGVKAGLSASVDVVVEVQLWGEGAHLLGDGGADQAVGAATHQHAADDVRRAHALGPLDLHHRGPLTHVAPLARTAAALGTTAIQNKCVCRNERA